ncbi:MAG: glycosyltransferase family 2 protein [bacterium]|nr:glycosyltransferase family 2 protein [bacterium]
MQEFAGLADAVIADGCSTDGSTDPAFLSSVGVRTLLSVQERGLGTATRAALSWALDAGYDGVVTLDGNGKDGVEAIPRFLRHLEDGWDLVQGGRFLPGGFHAHTPLERYLAIRFVMSPALWLASGFLYNDPTNAFRAISARFLRDARLQPFRPEFVRFSLQIYLIYQAARLGFRVTQIPVARVYPDDGTVPTKIVAWKDKWRNFSEMCGVAFGRYNPKDR